MRSFFGFIVVGSLMVGGLLSGCSSGAGEAPEAPKVTDGSEKKTVDEMLKNVPDDQKESVRRTIEENAKKNEDPGFKKAMEQQGKK
jgi:hypothetical protein